MANKNTYGKERMMKKVIVGLLVHVVLWRVVTLKQKRSRFDEATAESTLEQTPSEIPSELDAASEAEEALFSGLQECRWEPTRSRLLAHFDVNGDGRLDAIGARQPSREARRPSTHARARARFALGRRMARVKFIRWVYDADGSQSLDEVEKELLRADLEARCDARAGMMLENFDMDGDGDLSESEMDAARDARRAHHRERFEARLAEADTDGNGELSREEKARGARASS